ncbi:perilipin-3-like isoform X3 [Zonotrichia albicollis]|uniref:perilipin-3-like isoform X3 n=1 Tax=Zonotrichia albicollis TaxID=44394 RepID=UPI003D81246A
MSWWLSALREQGLGGAGGVIPRGVPTSLTYPRPPKISPQNLPLLAPAVAAMSAESAAVPAEPGLDTQSVVSRVASLPLVSCACGAVAAAYGRTKERHPSVGSVCSAAEKGLRTLTAAAASGAQPLLTRLEPQISTANKLACRGLDKLEEKLPVLQQPPERVVAGTRALVSGTVSGVAARTRSALGAVVGTRVGQLLASGVGTVLGKSEQLLDRYLPGMDQELVAAAGTEVTRGTEVTTDMEVTTGMEVIRGTEVTMGTKVTRGMEVATGTVVATGTEVTRGMEVTTGTEVATGTEVTTGTEVAPQERQRRWQSYFVRVGSLSARLPHRALRRSLGDLQRARLRAQRLLGQLHHVIRLIEEGQQGTDGPWHSAREHLHQLWLEWSQQDAVPMEDSEVESRTLAMLQGLLQQLHAACSHLAAGARAFPSSVQETAGHVRHGVEGVQASLGSARSLQELSGLVLAQSREAVTRAQLSLEGLLEHVGQHTPLPWLLGPFAPALVEYPEDVPVDMSKWEGCVTVGGTRRVPAAPQLCGRH